jgi:hypothetical protein
MRDQRSNACKRDHRSAYGLDFGWWSRLLAIAGVACLTAVPFITAVHPASRAVLGEDGGRTHNVGDWVLLAILAICVPAVASAAASRLIRARQRPLVQVACCACVGCVLGWLPLGLLVSLLFMLVTPGQSHAMIGQPMGSPQPERMTLICGTVIGLVWSLPCIVSPSLCERADEGVWVVKAWVLGSLLAGCSAALLDAFWWPSILDYARYQWIDGFGAWIAGAGAWCAAACCSWALRRAFARQ